MQTSQKNAVQQYDAAFHLLNVTFPMVRDPKLLMGVVNNIVASMEHAVDAILFYEHSLRLVPKPANDFQSKLNLFKYKCVRRNNIPTRFIHVLTELKELIKLHKQCPVQFQRGNRYVLANSEYQLKIVSINNIREYVNLNNEFLKIMHNIIKIQ